MRTCIITKATNMELYAYALELQIGVPWRRGGAGGEDIDSRHRQCACTESCVSVFKPYKHCIRKLSLIISRQLDVFT